MLAKNNFFDHEGAKKKLRVFVTQWQKIGSGLFGLG